MLILLYCMVQLSDKVVNEMKKLKQKEDVRIYYIVKIIL